jgi:threonine dehydratase
MDSVTFKDIQDAHQIIKHYIKKTPVVFSEKLNKMLGHSIFFKLENTQHTGSFKFRGALYSVLKLKDNPPKSIVTYGTGNHAVALAWAASKILDIKITAYLTDFTSDIKKKLIQEYGAKTIFTETREEAEKQALQESKKNGTILLPPSDNDDVIAGAATVPLEALEQLKEEIDAIFIPIGGGSLSSGTIITTNYVSPNTKIYGAEPESGNDALISVKNKKIHVLSKAPQTLADGAKTQKISERVFKYIQKIDDIYGITEQEIEYWTAWFNHLEISTDPCEPTSSLAIAAAARWLKAQTQQKKVLVIITGSNINDSTYKELAKSQNLDIMPDHFN